MMLAGFTNARVIIIRLGDRGCFIYDGRHYDFSSSREAYPVDETGSSESFVAALALRLSLGDNPRIAAEYASVCEALTMSRMGGVVALPKLAEAEEYRK